MCGVRKCDVCICADHNVYIMFNAFVLIATVNHNNNHNQYIYKQRQSHAMSQRRWLATAVIFHPSDMSLGFAET